MKKIFVLIICLLTLSSISQAQNYDKAIGIRFGYPTGMTYKQFIGSNSALEFIVGGGQNGGNLTVLYELHSEALDYSLNVVYGLGGHIGIWRENLNVGADGIFGLEFAPDSPIVFMIDIKPTLYLWRGNIRNSTGGAFSIRYAF